jgi:hypothetical protein
MMRVIMMIMVMMMTGHECEKGMVWEIMGGREKRKGY